MRKQVTQEELEERLRRLSAGLPEERGFSESVMSRIEADAGLPAREKGYRLWRWCMKGAIGIAASVVVGMVAWHLSVGEPRAAHGMGDVSERLMELKSLHMKGKVYQAGEEGKDLEVFVERPNKIRINGHQSSGGGGSGSTDVILTPEQYMEIDAAGKRVSISPETAVDAELRTEQLVQDQFLMLMSPSRGFKKTGTEKIGEVETEVYESKESSTGVRMEVWLDPAARMPVRSAMFIAGPDGKESPAFLFDTIEPNAVIPAGVFTFEVPKDYEVEKSTEGMTSGGMQVGRVKGMIRYAIAIDAKTVLLCWSMYDVNNPGADLGLAHGKMRMEMNDGEGKAYVEKTLRTDVSAEGIPWRWSVLTSESPAEDLGRVISMRVHVRNGEGTHVVEVVKLPANELEKVVEAVQQLTLPSGEKGMSLKEIEEKARE